MLQHDFYKSTHDAIYLPYIKNNINICCASGKDVLSSPFSGCHMVSFEYTGSCLFKKINGNADNCKVQKYGCEISYSFYKKTIIGHIAYEVNKSDTCQNVWENLKRDCSRVIDFDPVSEIAKKTMNSISTPSVSYGLITSKKQCVSIVLGV